MLMLARTTFLRGGRGQTGVQFLGALTGKNDGSSTLVITLSSLNLQTNDVVIAIHGTQAATPSGYTSLYDTTVLNVSYKVMPASPDLQTNFGIFGTGLAHVAMVMAFRRINTALLAAAGTGTSSGSVNPPNYTGISGNGNWALAIGGANTVTPSPGTITNYTTPGGDSQNAANKDASIWACMRELPNGTTSEDPAAFSAWSTSLGWGAATVVLVPTA